MPGAEAGVKNKGQERGAMITGKGKGKGGALTPPSRSLSSGYCTTSD